MPVESYRTYLSLKKYFAIRPQGFATVELESCVTPSNAVPGLYVPKALISVIGEQVDI